MKKTNTTEPFTPIYRRLADEYKDSILKLKYQSGDRIDSIARIQERHGVSRETAKVVLKALADEGYIIQRAGKGSFVSDIRPKKKIWGIILPHYSVFYEDLLHCIANHAAAMGRHIQHFVSYNKWQEEIGLVGRMINERYEAVIVVPTLDESKAADFYRRMTSARTLVALMDHTMSGSYFSYAIQSYDLGVRRGLQYLLGKTGGSIAFVRNEIWTGRNIVQELMEETFKGVLAAERPRAAPVVIDRISEMTVSHLRRNRVGGIFCCDDTDAVRVIGRLRDEGVLIPGDMSLVSYGNTDLARYFTPMITSIDCRTEEMAAKTVAMIKSWLKGGDVSLCQYVIQPDLVVRQT